MKSLLLLFACLALTVRADDNLLANGGFDDDDLGSPEGWQSKVGFGTWEVAISQLAPHQGKSHLTLSVTTDNGQKEDGGPGTGPGRVAVEQVTPIGSVVAGTRYILSVFSTSPTGFVETVAPRYRVEWLDDANEILDANDFVSFGASVGKDGYYEEFTTELTAPAEVSRARILFDIEGGDFNNPDSVASVLYLDTVSLRPAKSSP